MSKFVFRLEKVLEYRQMEEGWAKDAYLEARAARLEGEASIGTIEARRSDLLLQPVISLLAHQQLEMLMVRLDDEERAARTVLTVLGDEEVKALSTWQERRRDLQVLQGLREKAEEEWRREEARREQAALDEWATMRRAA